MARKQPRPSVQQVIERLIERNRHVDQEELMAAFKEQVVEDQSLRDALFDEVFELLHPIILKKADGGPLTKGEKATLKILTRERVTKADIAAAVDYFETRARG